MINKNTILQNQDYQSKQTWKKKPLKNKNEIKLFFLCFFVVAVLLTSNTPIKINNLSKYIS